MELHTTTVRRKVKGKEQVRTCRKKYRRLFRSKVTANSLTTSTFNIYYNPERLMSQ